MTLTRKSCYYNNCNFISHMIFMMCTHFYYLLVFALLLCGLTQRFINMYDDELLELYSILCFDYIQSTKIN